MSKYVIINEETNGYFNEYNDTQFIFLEAIKVDENLNIIDEFKEYIKPQNKLTDNVIKKTGFTNEQLENGRNEKEVISEFRSFCENSKVIVYNAKFTLSFLLKALYRNGIKEDFKFHYISLKNIFEKNINVLKPVTKNNIKLYYNIEEKDDITSIKKILKCFLKENNINDLDDYFKKDKTVGRVFRGLNYPKYMFDVMAKDKYFGYIVDMSEDRYVSYYSHLKELRHEFFTIEEANELRKREGKVIFNVHYLTDESLTFTDYYSIHADDEQKITSDCKELINGINRFVEYKRQGKKLKLVLWGTIENLREKYSIIDECILEELISSINIIKGRWDRWTEDEFKEGDN